MCTAFDWVLRATGCARKPRGRRPRGGGGSRRQGATLVVLAGRSDKPTGLLAVAPAPPVEPFPVLDKRRWMRVRGSVSAIIGQTIPIADSLPGTLLGCRRINLEIGRNLGGNEAH